MPGYITLLIDIDDHEAFTDYVRHTAPTLESHGGRITLRGPIVDVLEGTIEKHDDSRLVVVEFESPAQARTWWESDDYRPLVKLREPPVARTRALLVDGVDLRG